MDAYKHKHPQKAVDKTCHGLIRRLCRLMISMNENSSDKDKMLHYLCTWKTFWNHNPVGNFATFNNIDRILFQNLKLLTAGPILRLWLQHEFRN
jgi:hypothetical protein